MKSRVSYFLVLLGIASSLLLVPTSELHAKGKKKETSSSCEGLLDLELSPFEQVRIIRAKKGDRDADKLLNEIEQFLLNARVLRVKKLGGGVTPSFKVKLGPHLYAVFKPDQSGDLRKPNREVAAYRVSKRFGLDLVPPTVIREIEGQVGSFQLFIRGATVLRDDPNYDWERKKSGRRLRIFDWLINNHDRGSNQGNYLISEIDGEIIGIDHGLGFISESKEARADKVPRHSRRGLRDRDLLARLSRPTEDELREDLKAFRTRRQREFFRRLKKLIKKMERAMS